MGLKNWLHNKRMSDPASGTYQLTSCSRNSGGATYENCRMNGVVVAAGVAPTAVEHVCMAPTKRWPSPGETLPVTIDRADPTRLHFEWDDIRTGRDRGRQLAQDLAASMAVNPTVSPGRTTGPVPQAGTGDGAAADALTQDLIAQAEARGAHVTSNVTYSVVAAPGRAVPGASGGGLTPEQALTAAGNPAFEAATARVIVAHEVVIPPGMPGGGAAGTVDLTMDVTPPSGEGWVATMRISFSTPEKRLRVATVGTVLPVFVNPQAHDQIAIDTATLG